MANIGDIIKGLRRQNNMDMDTLARKLRVSKEDVINIESGLVRVEDKLILDLACAFRLSSIEYNNLKRLREGQDE